MEVILWTILNETLFRQHITLAIAVKTLPPPAKPNVTSMLCGRVHVHVHTSQVQSGWHRFNIQLHVHTIDRTWDETQTNIAGKR